MWYLVGCLICFVGSFLSFNVLIKNANLIADAYNRQNGNPTPPPYGGGPAGTEAAYGAASGETCFCSRCGEKMFTSDRFCPQCGKPKPAGVPQYRCDKCGWEPEDPTKPPRFCPECGDPFGDEDKI